jgi:phage terminase large subunit GpA-like protein
MKDTETQVCRDILSRQQLGKLKYGTTVAENPLTLRQWINHGYEEALDLSVYLKRAMQEIDTIRQQEQARCIAIVYGQCSSDNEAQRIVDAIKGKA